MNREQITGIVICLIMLVYGLTIAINQYNEEKNELCKIYSEQELTAMRYPIGGGEREYSLNGTWVKESTLMEDCEK